MIIKEYEKSGYWLFKKRSYIPLILLLLATVYIWQTTIPFYHDVAMMDKLLQSGKETSVLPKMLKNTGVNDVALLINQKDFSQNEKVYMDTSKKKDEGFQDSPYLFLEIYWMSFCLFVSFLGILIRAITIGFTPKATSGRNTNGQVADTLNTKGIYACVRHPLYFGNILMWAGILIYPGDIWLAIIGLTFFWLYYERIMIAEEAFLYKKFGKPYALWTEHTNMFIPNFTKWQTADLKFSLANVLKREYPGLLAVSISFLYCFLLKYYFLFFNLEISEMPQEPYSNFTNWLKDYLLNPFDTKNYPSYFWIVFFVLALTTTIVIKVLRKTTNIFEVEGR